MGNPTFAHILTKSARFGIPYSETAAGALPHEGGRAAKRAPLGEWARRTLRGMRARPSAPPRPGHHSCTPRSACACTCAYLPRAGGWILCARALLAPSARGVPYFSTASALALWPAARPHDTLLESCVLRCADNRSGDGSGIFTLTEASSRTPSWPRSPWAARKRGVAPLWECRRTSTAPAEAPTTCSTSPVAGEPACPHAHACATQVCNVACSDVGGRWPAAIVPRHRRPA